MSRSHRWLPKYAVMAASFAIVLAACSASTSSNAPSTAPSAASEAPASSAPSASAAAYDAMAYPATAIDCAKPPTGYTGEFSQIKAVDRLTVEFDMCAPDVSFLSKIAFATNGILDSDWLAAHAKDKSYVKTTNGTGPYMVKEWVSGDHITMVANPNYTGPNKPISPTLIFKWADTAAKRLQDLQAGTVDGMDNVAPDDFDTVTNDSTLQLLKRDAFSTLYLGFNVDQAPWNNEAVRQAIAQGIDREADPRPVQRPGLDRGRLLHPVQRRGRLRGRPLVCLQQGRGDRGPEGGQLRLQQDLRPVLPPEGPPVLPEPAGHRHGDPGAVQGTSASTSRSTPRTTPPTSPTRARASTRCSSLAGVVTTRT